jgi:hypothetical protein
MRGPAGTRPTPATRASSLRPTPLGQRVDHFEKLEPVKASIPGDDSPDALLPHQRRDIWTSWKDVALNPPYLLRQQAGEDVLVPIPLDECL